jgi:hypothetical protein
MTSGVTLAVWSGPRNISTALMRSFENRSDCRVVDEPLYAYFLSETGLDHPGRDEVIEAGETSWESVVAELCAPVDGVYYQKQMAHHLIPQLPRQWIASIKNILLIRDPAEVVASYAKTRTAVEIGDIGLIQQVELLEDLEERPPVIDSADFLENPEDYLRWMCRYAGVKFTPEMLHWPAGRRASDGVWGKYWYETVWKSTGFALAEVRKVQLEGAALDVAKSARPLYERLHSERILL